MLRKRLASLTEWLKSPARKPLIVRGARQVGKTWLIRALAQQEKLHLIELNFERDPNLASLFVSNDPREIMMNIAALKGGKSDPATSLLFLDEIQSAPHLLQKLRWFAEEMPSLPVVAAGSLLDFALAEHAFSMPVGRVGYFYLEPISFEEFLEAIGKSALRHYLQRYTLGAAIPEALHIQLMKHLKEYLIVGGMPAAVAAWAAEKDPALVQQIHADLLSTYRDDFAKYRGRIALERLEEVMSAVPYQLGKKFVYKEVNSGIASASLKHALLLLCQARVCHRVVSTKANGLPLDAERDERFSKIIMLDCGLCSAALGLSLHQLQSISELTMINSGGMAEQLAGQLLRTTFPAYLSPTLHYWQRDKKGGSAELDYIIQYAHELIPIEVKAGMSGTLKSLHQFMKEKEKSFAVRINSAPPRYGPIDVKDTQGNLVHYQLLSLPFYLIEQLHRFLQTLKDAP